MKRSNGSRWEVWNDEGSRPAGERTSGVDERTSGVRARQAPIPPDEAGPCTSFEEAYRRNDRFVRARIWERMSGDPSAATDVFQKVFIRLDRRLRRNSCVPYPLRPVLLGLIDDEVKNHARARRRCRSDGAPDSEIPSSKPDPEHLLGDAERSAELKREVHATLARMSADDVELLTHAEMRESETLLDDIAARLGITGGALRARLHRARARFAALYRFNQRSRREP